MSEKVSLSKAMPKNHAPKPLQQSAPARVGPGDTGPNLDVDPAALTPQKILALQRVAGNRAVGGLLAQRRTTALPKRASEDGQTLQPQASPSPAPSSDRTGLPEGLKRGVETLSGVSMDNVKVHYNSSQPDEVDALAYAQGSEIHVAAGQEQHLPHEAWHLVQQAQGRVRPTLQMKGDVAVNDDDGLEQEATVMGARALQAGQANPASAADAVSELPVSDPHPGPLAQGEAAEGGLNLPAGSAAHKEAGLLPNTARHASSVQRKINAHAGVIQRGKKEQDAEAASGVAKAAAETARDTAEREANSAETAIDYETAKGHAGKADTAYETAKAAFETAKTKAGIANTLVANTNKQNALSASQKADGHRNRAWNAVSAKAEVKVTELTQKAMTGFKGLLTRIEKSMDEILTLVGNCASAASYESADAVLKNVHKNRETALKILIAVEAGKKVLADASLAADEASALERTKVEKTKEACGVYEAAVLQALEAIKTAVENAEKVTKAKKDAEDAAKAAADAQQAATGANEEAKSAAEAAASALERAKEAAALVLTKQKVEKEAALKAQQSRQNFDAENQKAQQWETNLTQPFYQEQAKKAPGGAAQVLADARQRAEGARVTSETDQSGHEQTRADLQGAEKTAATRTEESDKAGSLAEEKKELKAKADLESTTKSQEQKDLAVAEKTTSKDVGDAVNLANANNASSRELRVLAGGEPEKQKLLALVPAAAELKTLLTAIRAQNPDVGVGEIIKLINLKGAATILELAAFVTNVGARGKLGDINDLLGKTQTLAAVPTLTELGTFVTSSGAGSNLVRKLTDLVDWVKASGTLAEITGLIQTIGANGTLDEIISLLRQASDMSAKAKVTEVRSLVLAATAVANVASDLFTLLFRIGKKGSVPETTVLVTRIKALHNAATIPEIKDLVVDAGIGNNVCVQLTTIVNAVAANGTMPQITNMVKQAVTTLGANHISDVAVLINRAPANNTPVNVLAFLTALNPNTRDRFNRIHPKIVRFTRLAHPGGATVNYVSHGINFSCNRWAFLSERHTYEYFDFAGAKPLNSMWPVGTNPQNELGTAMGALTLQKANNLSAGGYHAENVGVAEVGVDNSWVTHLMPLAADEIYTQAETNAIRNLR